MDDWDGGAEAGERESTLERAVEAQCPYCGEPVQLIVDPGGGADQDYVEDCEVCCRPWAVRLAFDAEGRASVTLDPLD